MEKRSLSKEELIEQLKALANQEVDQPMRMGQCAILLLCLSGILLNVNLAVKK